MLRQTLEDTLPAMEGVDLLITHPLSYSARLAAELRNVRWFSTVLSPCMFLSAYDLPILAPGPLLPAVRSLGPKFTRAIISLIRWRVRSWSAPWHRLRKELGLPPGSDPLLDSHHSPELVLALFSRHLGARQPDWPAQTQITGFPFSDQEDATAGLPPELAGFLDDGPPPVVFTLGSAAVMNAGRFYEFSAAAAERLGCRAVLVTGHDPRNQPVRPLPPRMIAIPAAPFSQLFPRASAIVHQGGIGTTAQAMRSGRPMLVVPYSHDQPDNAARVVRLGIARTVSRHRYAPARAAAGLSRLLNDPAYRERSAETGKRLRDENGVEAACDAISKLA